MAAARVVVVGSGIVGLAHALTARDAGFEVELLERRSRPLGASVRNFGTLWPIGCAHGSERDQALRGVRRWKELAHDAKFWLAPSGSLSLAYREEAQQVLEEFCAGQRGDEDEGSGLEMLDAREVLRRFPAVNPEGLRGALRSTAEAQVQPAEAIAALVRLAERRGVGLHFGTAATRIEGRAVLRSDGRRFEFDRLVVAAGDEMDLLFPREIAAAGVQRCRLQMLRTRPQPRAFELGAILVSDLTLVHYPAFRGCPSTAGLRARLAAELPLHVEEGIHVIAAQHPDGSLVIGDSHEYGSDFDPALRSDIEERILDALRAFVRVPEPAIASRWEGIYTKSTRGETQVILRPREDAILVAALGGLGMTLSFGLAERTIAEWTSR